MVKYHYIKNLIQIKKIILKYKKIQKMIANNFTKSLSPIAFKKFVKYLGLIIEIEIEQ